MSLPTEFPFASASQLVAALRKKSVSATELCEASIDRIEKLDGPINAVVVRDFDRARHDAKNADAALAKGQTLPLLGVPMTVKESFDLEGHPTTWGVPDHRAHKATSNALAVQRLKAAGAVILGKTNVPPVLADWQSANPIYGRTNNPYDVSRSPGGSSGGGAAAIAMGFSALEVGSDIGGSVRVPAALCGTYGVKTSWGLLPADGHAMGGAQIAPPLLAVLGPIARSADDLLLALDVLAGPNEMSPANRVALPPPRHDRIGNYRVFLLDHHPAARIDGAIHRALETTADRLVASGATVARSSSHFPSLDSSWRTYQAMLHTITTRRSSDPNARPPISAHEWMDRLDEQQALRRQWAEFFRHFDIVLAPAFSTTAFPHTDEPDWRKRTLTIDGEATPYGAQLAWASMASVGNLPSAIAPVGMHEGLPIGLQCIAPHLEDKTAARFAGLIGQEIPHPKLAT